MEGLPLFLIVDLTSSIYAVNDALISKGIVKREFLEARKKHYENAIKEGLKALAALQSGKMTRAEAEEKLKKLGEVLTWDTTLAQESVSAYLEELDP